MGSGVAGPSGSATDVLYRKAEEEKHVNEKQPAMKIPVTEGDLQIAMSELHNAGRFELVGVDGERVVLLSASRCDECEWGIPDVGEGMVNRYHSPTCSLHGIGA